MLRHTKDLDQAPRNGHGMRLRSVGKFLVVTVIAITPLSLPAAATYPPAGLDEFPSAAGLEADLSVIGGPVVSATVKGPTRIRRGDPMQQSDGRNVIDTEIVSLDLTGGTTSFPITVRESSTRESSGIIRQQTPGVDFPADSFFDIFVEIDTPLGVVHNKQPVRLGAVINAIPPLQAQYIPEETFVGVDLFTADGLRVGILRHAAHFVGQHPFVLRRGGWSVKLDRRANAIPPLQAQYIPEETFVGVDLFTADGLRVGILRHAAHFVGQHPSFSVAAGGPSSLSSAGIFDLPTSTPPPIPASSLGLTEADELDALAYGTDFIASIMVMRFSVDPRSQGVIGSGVKQESEKSPNEAHGDEFWTSVARLGSNVQQLDENGDTAPPFPLLISDDVDGLTEPPTSFVDTNSDGVPENPVYLSLAEGSPSLRTLGVAAGDILATSGGSPPSTFIPSTNLGLVEGDDVDAICLGVFIDEDREEQRVVLFSLAPGSSSLVAGGLSPADLFLVQVGQGTGPPTRLTPWAPASSLGLLNEDNLNALKCSVPRVHRPPHSVLRFKCNGEEIDTWGHIKVLAAVGPNGEAFRSSGPYDLVAIELVELSLQGTGSQGPVNVWKRPFSRFPHQSSRGVVQDMDGTVGILDVEPYGEGEAWYFLDLFLEIEYNGQILHHSQPIRLHGIVTQLPPRPDEALQQQLESSTPAISPKPLSLGEGLTQFAFRSPEAVFQQFAAGDGKSQGTPEIPLFTEDGQPSGLSLSDVIFWPNLPLPTPIINAGGIVNGASFQQGAAPDAIMSIFGTDLADALDVAETIPLPTTLAGTTVTVADSEGNQGGGCAVLGACRSQRAVFAVCRLSLADQLLDSRWDSAGTCHGDCDRCQRPKLHELHCGVGHSARPCSRRRPAGAASPQRVSYEWPSMARDRETGSTTPTPCKLSRWISVQKESKSSWSCSVRACGARRPEQAPRSMARLYEYWPRVR